MFLVYVGSIIVVIGVFLPWVGVSAEMGQGIFEEGFRITEQTASGFQVNQGLFSAVIAIISAILGSKGTGKKLISFFIILLSIALVTITYSLIADPGGATMEPFGARVTVNLKPGVFISAFGGVILFFGGLVSLFSSD